jgi:hypothetical protein
MKIFIGRRRGGGEEDDECMKIVEHQQIERSNG